MDATRLVPHRTLPAYSYVNGQHPHPRREPGGHSHGLAEPSIDNIDESDWRACEEYLFGIDLFNRGYYWEAHESWEAAWNAVGRTGSTADFFKGLIKLAAAGVKAREGRAAGVRRHAKRAEELLKSVTSDGSSQRFGLPVKHLIELAELLQQNPDDFIDTRQLAVVVVFPTKLQPQK